MNQILLTENNKKDKNKKVDRNNSGDMKKIIIFFSIIILVFGIAIGGLYGYKIYKNNKKEEVIPEKPQVALEETEDTVKIIAKAEAGMSKIIYSWNNEEPVEVDMNGRTSHEEQMDIPIGKNLLNVKIIDINNEKAETTKEFVKKSTKKPVIETEIGEDAKLIIKATDEKAIKYLTYKWNDEEATKVEAQTETDTVIEVKIDVKRGTNILTVKAVNSEDNEEEITKRFDGVNKPIIEVFRQGKELHMKISHDMGFKKVEFSANGQIYTYDENYQGYDANQKLLEFKFNLKDGENTIIIQAISNETTETEEGVKNIDAIYKGKCTYTEE